VDGTLYYQIPIRSIMLLLLVVTHLYNPFKLIKKLRVINAYHRAQENLRKKYCPPTEHFNFKLHELQRSPKKRRDLSVLSSWNGFNEGPCHFFICAVGGISIARSVSFTVWVRKWEYIRIIRLPRSSKR